MTTKMKIKTFIKAELAQKISQVMRSSPYNNKDDNMHT